jgi:stearoyl-CoA 9-desaturase NADPH oxidoreductase
MPSSTVSRPKAWPRIARHITRVVEHPLLSGIVRASALDDSLTALHPMLSLQEVRARVVNIIQETHDTTTFVLQPNAQWLGALSGQFVRVMCEINGRQVERVYSLSSRGGARPLSITVKRQPLGRMSEHLHHHVRIGDVLRLSQAAGNFTLPATLPAKILLLSAGSGITPVMSMLRELLAHNFQGDVVFVHSCADANNRIFAAELDAMQSSLPGLRLVTHFSRQQGRMESADLEQWVPDMNERSTWMCGPANWMDGIHALWSERGWHSPLQSERFGPPPARALAVGEPVKVTCNQSKTSFSTDTADNLLVQAEQAGLQPQHGCRIGICHSCQCIKRSGTVQNLVTGEVSSAPNERIRICISQARSDVVLDI